MTTANSGKFKDYIKAEWVIQDIKRESGKHRKIKASELLCSVGMPSTLR